MNTLEKLQQWYASQCNEDWEHQYGVHIETLDNPGWLVKVDLWFTYLEKIPFEPVKINCGENYEGLDWLHCQKTETRFQGACGPHLLEQTLTIFLDWAAIHAPEKKRA